MVRKITKKIGLVVLGIVLTLIILELLLRLGGFAFLALQNSGNEITDDKEGIYRILALGESTTANLLNGQSSWPEELEIMLNKRSKEIKFKVFNEGVPSTRTWLILSELEGNLEKYNPDMVITMMGVNDRGVYVRHKSDVLERITLPFKNFRVYKLSRLLSAAVKNKIKENEARINETKFRETEKELKNAVETDPENLSALSNLLNFYYVNKNYDEAVEVAKKVAELDPDSYLIFFMMAYSYDNLDKNKKAEQMYQKTIEINPRYRGAYVELGNLYYKLDMIEKAIDMYEKSFEKTARVGEHVVIRLAELYIKTNNFARAYELLKAIIDKDPNRLNEISSFGKLYKDLNKTDEAVELFKRTIEKNPDNYPAYSELGWHYLTHNKSKEAEKIFRKAWEANPYNLIWIYGNLGGRYQEQGQFENADVMFKRAAAIRLEYSNSRTQESYRELYFIARERGIKLVVMQYPTLDVEELKKISIGDEEIIFVSNEENFRKVLANATYEEYFIDRIYGGSFGHATKKGNQLIAENVANAVLAELE